eukprot:gnl/MRDRNA2_/MRDRNA2_106841_c0_seq1.p1 gnl/MRDRNA2_/MRDRNA2_106841_c0~~gnl/MRDRNA2_/MRDRNA2_106841_c0_seq1.p1  ORF type:complete len:756 (+),score=177.31 gnl/MRDRNA2_/MRDRNA2_106841_c0_seq1:321-2270(+)
MHIAQGIFKSINVNKCTQAGGTFIFWVADWFALMNDKMGGDLEKIKIVGKYLIEVWKATGMDMTRVKFLWSSDEINGQAKTYWTQMMDISRRFNLTRIMKCCQIMGRKEGSLTAAQILYPCMQCTDIFFLNADICQLGVDQRKVNMLAREWCDAAGRKEKPIILSHHMLYGLKAGQSKMSKSDPDSAIFMEDKPEDVERKINNAYCPMKAESAAKSEDDEEMHLVKDELKNPCLDYVKYIIFSNEGITFTAGGKTYTNFEDVKAAFVSSAMTEKELKAGIILEVNKLLDPVREHFSKDKAAKELFEKVQQFKKDSAPISNELKRLVAFKDKKTVTFAVFAPLPTESISVETIWGILARLREAPPNSDVVLWLEDWSAFCLNRLGASKEAIKAYYDLLLHGLQSQDPGVMKGVRVIWQADTVLTEPSGYWISVINAGRRCNLQQVSNALPSGEQLDNAGKVVATLMHVGDCLSLCSDKGLILSYDPETQGNLHKFLSMHFDACGLKAPELKPVAAPALRLQQDAHLVDAVTVYITDSEMEVNGKIKKAFAEPGNVAYCPPIDWAGELIAHYNKGEFTVKRKPDNGGDKSFTDVATLKKDYESGALHPGDLKPSLSKAVNEVLAVAREGLKSAELKKAVAELAKLGKKKKK